VKPSILETTHPKLKLIITVRWQAHSHISGKSIYTVLWNRKHTVHTEYHILGLPQVWKRRYGRPWTSSWRTREADLQSSNIGICTSWRHACTRPTYDL